MRFARKAWRRHAGASPTAGRNSRTCSKGRCGGESPQRWPSGDLYAGGADPIVVLADCWRSRTIDPVESRPPPRVSSMGLRRGAAASEMAARLPTLGAARRGRCCSRASSKCRCVRPIAAPRWHSSGLAYATDLPPTDQIGARRDGARGIERPTPSSRRARPAPAAKCDPRPVVARRWCTGRPLRRLGRRRRLRRRPVALHSLAEIAGSPA